MTVTTTTTDYCIQISPSSFSFALEKRNYKGKIRSKSDESKYKNPRVAPGRDRVQTSPSCDGITECFGEGTIYSPSEDLGKEHTQKMTGENREDTFHEANVIANLENRDIEGIAVESGKENLFSSGPNIGFGLGESRVTLYDILEGLTRLDESGIFSNPVENPLDPKFSDINGKCKSFTMICKKIESQEYPSWKSFVDDFEYICNDVMCYYQRNTMSWKAAKNVLHRGRIYLDQVAKRANWNFCCFTKTDEQNGAQNLEAFNNQNASLGNAVALELKQNNIKWAEETTFCSLPRKAPMQPDVTKNVQHLKTGGNLCVQEDECPLDHSFSNLANATFCAQQKLDNYSTAVLGSSNLSGLGTEVDDTVVDITGSGTIWNDVRVDSPDQATESSSSFGDTDADDYETCGSVESESELHNGNAAATVENYGCASIMRKKRRLSDDWKSYRRAIEWRCHWLELHVKEFQSRASKYDCILKNIQSKKLQRDNLTCIKDSAARATPLTSHSIRQHILHRKPKKVRNEKDLSAYMSQHPLFSLYENRTEADGRLVEDDPNNLPIEAEGELISRMSYVRDFSLHLGIAGAIDGENTIELMLWNIENLQSRIIKMRNQLKKFVKRNSTNNITHYSWSIQSTKGTVQDPMFTSTSNSRNQVHVGRGSKVQTGSLACRRISDFDINNVVMPCNSMAVYVEPARHGFIETPHWRFIGDSMKLDQNTEDTSEEATDDEVYIERHRYMEMKEKYIRSAPNPGKKLPARVPRFGLGITSGSTQTRTGIEDICTIPQESELPSPCCYLPWDGPVPKGKRNGRRRPSFIRDA